jgi:predicted transcriptional regulator
VKSRRTHYEIYWEILTFCKTPKTFTNIINRCNLNSKIGQEHLQFLTGKGLLMINVDAEKRVFMTSERANNYLTIFTTMYKELFEKSPEFKL